MSIELRHISKTFGAFVALQDVSLTVGTGELVALLGPSGSGKTTLLRIIAGLERPDDGSVAIAGEDVTDSNVRDRRVGFVFQHYALFRHMTVFENIAFPLRVEKLPSGEVNTRVGEAARVLQLESRLQQRPGTLSGGQRQRVAIGRAIVREPEIFLFDEPLSNLDASLRTEMRIELMRLHKKLGATMVYVTHDQVEAMTMADKIVVLNAGEIEQVGTPQDLYSRPINRFVAGFIGNPRMNFIEGMCSSAGISGIAVDLGALGTISIPREGSADIAGQPVTVGIRPEHIEMGSDGFSVALKPAIIERLGIHTITYAPLPSGDMFAALFEGEPPLAENREIRVKIDPALCHLFDVKGNALGSVA